MNSEGGQLRAGIASGGTVLFGTDLGAVDPDPSEEHVLMAQAGMSFSQILASLTIARRAIRKIKSTGPSRGGFPGGSRGAKE